MTTRREGTEVDSGTSPHGNVVLKHRIVAAVTSLRKKRFLDAERVELGAERCERWGISKYCENSM